MRNPWLSTFLPILNSPSVVIFLQASFIRPNDVLRAALHQFDEMDLAGLKKSAEDEDLGRIVSLQTAAASIRRKHNFSDSQ
jgi:hypothetical protein